MVDNNNDLTPEDINNLSQEELSDKVRKYAQEKLKNIGKKTNIETFIDQFIDVNSKYKSYISKISNLEINSYSLSESIQEYNNVFNEFSEFIECVNQIQNEISTKQKNPATYLLDAIFLGVENYESKNEEFGKLIAEMKDLNKHIKELIQGKNNEIIQMKSFVGVVIDFLSPDYSNMSGKEMLISYLNKKSQQTGLKYSKDLFEDFNISESVNLDESIKPLIEEMYYCIKDECGDIICDEDKKEILEDIKQLSKYDQLLYKIFLENYNENSDSLDKLYSAMGESYGKWAKKFYSNLGGEYVDPIGEPLKDLGNKLEIIYSQLESKEKVDDKIIAETFVNNISNKYISDILKRSVDKSKPLVDLFGIGKEFEKGINSLESNNIYDKLFPEKLYLSILEDAL